MRFIGQFHIMKQLRFLLPDLYETGRGANFLFRGPSGYGKTTMALSVCKYLADSDFQVFLGDSPNIDLKKKVIFIDEIHEMSHYEWMYPIMDEKSHVLVFATNQDSNLPEAFTNRCWEYVFDDYSTDELLLIALEASSFSTTDENLLEIVEAGNRNPRIIKSLLDRMGTYFKHNPHINPRTANFQQILEEVFSIKDGLDTLCRRYIEVLQDIGGTASLYRLKTILHTDEGTLVNTVEPVLLRKKLIEITKKGRTLYDDNS